MTLTRLGACAKCIQPLGRKATSQSTRKQQAPTPASWRKVPHTHMCLSLVVLVTLATLVIPAHAGSSDLAVDNIWLEKALAPAQPVTDTPVGEQFYIIATVKNSGQETAYGYYLDAYYESDYGRGDQTTSPRVRFKNGMLDPSLPKRAHTPHAGSWIQITRYRNSMNLTTRSTSSQSDPLRQLPRLLLRRQLN